MEYYLLYYDLKLDERTGAEAPDLIYAVSLGDISDEIAEFFAIECRTSLINQSTYQHEYPSTAKAGNSPVYVIRPDLSLNESTTFLCARAVARFERESKSNPHDEVIIFMREIAQVAEEYGKRFLPTTALVSGVERTNATDESDGGPSMFIAASGRGNSKAAVDVCQESIEWANEPLEMIIKNGEPIAVQESPDSPVIKVLKEIVTAVKANTTAREDAVFRGTYRAIARFEEPMDEIPLEKVYRLREDRWPWKDVIKQVYPDTTEEDIDRKVDEVRKQLERDLANSKKGPI